MANIHWGRKETIIFPPHSPIYTYGAVFFAVILTGLFVYLRFTFGNTPLQRFYTAIYVRSSVAGGVSVGRKDKYRLVMIAARGIRPRPATDADVRDGNTPQPGAKTLPLALSQSALQAGYDLLYQDRERTYIDAPLSAYLKSVIYSGDSLFDIYQLPLFFGLVSLLLQLPFSIQKDIKRRKQMRYGRRLRGTERLAPKEFNRKVEGDGLGIKIDGLRGMLRIPVKAEAQHVQIIADTGGGKTTIIMQMLRQIRGRGDSAIVYDPALEYTRRFYDPRHDIILNPLDRRCPSWGPAEELRTSSEADAIAVSLFQPPQDKKGEFFFEIPQQIFAYLLRYGPIPEELIAWMSNPMEIDNRVARTEVANFIDRTAPPQRVGVLASLSKVAKSLRLLPPKGAGNGQWTATDWSETRQGWIFMTSLPAEREAIRPLQSVWIDMLVLRLLNEPKAHQKRVWFVLDELASLQRLPQFHTALTENRKSNNPIIMGFQGKAQLEVIYGHLAEVMLSMPTTSIFLRTKEPNAGEWVSKAIGKVEIERMKESHFDGTRSGRNFALDIQVEPAVMESEISGLPDLHAFLKYENYVTGFSFPYLDIEGHQIPFERRHLPDEKLTFDPKSLKGKGRPGTAAPPPAVAAAPPAVVDLEAKPVEETKTAARLPNNDLATVEVAPDAGKNTGAEASDNIVNAKQPRQTTLNFTTN